MKHCTCCRIRSAELQGNALRRKKGGIRYRSVRVEEGGGATSQSGRPPPQKTLLTLFSCTQRPSKLRKVSCNKEERGRNGAADRSLVWNICVLLV